MNPGPSNEAVRTAWENIAGFWDDSIGPDGNEWHQLLVAPAQLKLLELEPGQRVLEVACGNGQFARAMAARGAHVAATDFSESFLARARAHAVQDETVTYSQLDVTDEDALIEICRRPFDAVVATMALMDISDIRPLAKLLPTLLRPGGRFVFSVMHPCFNSADIEMTADRHGPIDGSQVEHGVRVRRYLDLPPTRGIGILGQPEQHIYFHRPLHELLGTFLAKGMVLDGLFEPAFPERGRSDRAANWETMPQIPPAFVARMRPAAPLP